MRVPTSPKAFFDAVSWHVRGLFATEANRRIGFRARELWQPAEIEARKGLGKDIAAQVSAELRVDRDVGHLMLPAASIPSLEEVCNIGRSIIANATLADGETTGDKKFFRIRVASYDERVSLLRVALDQRVLAMAAAYLGVLPVITEADYFCSFPVGGAFTKSQLWHCDCDSSDVFKLFIYCDDVDADNGPFELIDSVTSHHARNAIGYRYAGRRYRVSDELMDANVDVARVKPILGPGGTAFVVDTGRCFHRGSRIIDPSRRRVMATVCYCPPVGTSLPRRLSGANAPLAEFARSFPGKLERAALGLPVASRWI